MADLLEGKQQCSLCNEHHDHCFDLGFAHTKRFSDTEKKGKVGCYDCLRRGEFEFRHDTEIGPLDEKGLTRIYTHNMAHPLHLDDSILTELKRTPQIVTYQPDVWLTHCNDFMVYAGTWEPLDFYKNSASGDGRGFFMEMTDDEINHTCGMNHWKKDKHCLKNGM